MSAWLKHMESSANEDLLILTKTYPSPSTTYRETTCVAAINQAGALRRLFPVPYRLLEGKAQFNKWEWIRARISKTPKDKRPESYRIDADSIVRPGKKIETKKGDWSERIKWIEPHVIGDFDQLNARQQTTGNSFGFLRPTKIIRLIITPAENQDWSEAEKSKLIQDGLFDTDDVRNRPPLRKLPFDFHYEYESGGKKLKHKLVDWEAGALYWNCITSYGQSGWEAKFRQRFEAEFSQKDLLFLMGTIHRFPDQWLIVGIIYPPKRPPDRSAQLDLLPAQ